MRSYQDRILDLVRAVPPVDVQNRLMTADDGALAMAMLYMGDMDREKILGFISRAKAERVREEVRRNDHVRILYSQYETAASTIIRKLSGDRNVKSAKRYYRPFRGSDR